MSKEEQAQNQEQVIDVSEELYYSPTSKKHLRFDEEEPTQDEEYEDDEPALLTRSNAFVERRPWPAKEPMYREAIGEQSLESSSGDEEFRDLAWFFANFYPELDPTKRIAWCRTYANMLAAMQPKNRPQTYKKRKTE